MEELYKCESCCQSIPLRNKTIHDVRCRRLNSNNKSSRSSRNSFQNDNSINSQRIEASPQVAQPFHSHSNFHSRTTNIPIVDLTNSPENFNISDGWQCEACTYNNPNVENLLCDVCGTPRIPIIDSNIESDIHFEDYGNNSYDDSDHRPIRNSTNRTEESSQSNLGDHDYCSTSSSTGTWNCSSCTLINGSNVDNCSACGTARPPLPSRHEVLVPDMNGMIVDDDEDDTWADDVFGSTQSSLMSSALLGAGVGAGLAFMRGGSVSEGIVGGAGLGLLGGALHSGFAIQQQQQQRRRNPHGRRLPQYMDRSSSSSSSSYSNRRGRRHIGAPADPFADPHLIFAEMMQQHMQQSMRLHHRVGAMDIDGLSYEQLLERFQAPPRGVDCTTMASLPTHSYQAKPSSSSSSSTSASAPPAEEDNCCCLVCLEPFQQGEQLLSLPCCHSFHDPCIRRWLQGQNTCPVCKFAMPVER